MHEDSPPPFIVIRTPAATHDVYERALELVGHVQHVLDEAQVRFHLKDRLDRAVTALVFELSRAKTEVKSVRWRNFRRAHALASDCSTILDILRAQRTGGPHLDAAQGHLHVLLQELGTLG